MKLWLALVLVPSVALTVTEYVLAEPVTVPVINPVLELIDNPEGRPVAEKVQP